MVKKQSVFAAFAVALVMSLLGINSLKDNRNLYCSLTMSNVEAMSMCEGQGGYKLENCTPSKGKTCYAPGGEFWAKDCTYIKMTA